MEYSLVVVIVVIIYKMFLSLCCSTANTNLTKPYQSRTAIDKLSLLLIVLRLETLKVKGCLCNTLEDCLPESETAFDV